MQKNKCVIRFEKRKIATKEERDKYKDIVKHKVITEDDIIRMITNT